MISSEIDDDIDGDFDTIQQTEMTNEINLSKTNETDPTPPDSAYYESRDNQSFDNQSFDDSE